MFFSEGGGFLNILQAKAILFSAVVLLSLLHDFWRGPGCSSGWTRPGQPEKSYLKASVEF